MTTTPIAYLAGPTASGKTALAIRLAEKHGLAIVSCDSMQVYRGVEIGTAQPSAAERGDVPHELIGIAEPGEEFHAARFVRDAQAAIARHAAGGRRSIVVGGTGLWMRSLRIGLAASPGRNDEIRKRLRRVLASEGAPALFAILEKADPLAARAVMPGDHIRVLRALEVFESSGRSIVEWNREDAARRASAPPPKPLVAIVPQPPDHAARIEDRVHAMLAAGWLDEAARLRALGIPEHAPPMKALGYPELFRVLAGELSIGDATRLIVIATRQFARRQRKWFQSERRAAFLPSGDAEAELERVIANETP